MGHSQNRQILTHAGYMRSAEFSTCGTYRYALRRTWLTTAAQVLFIGLNPSTADEKSDDPTIRRCLGYARSWGYGSLTVANLFAYRATDPADLRAASDPIGPLNDQWIVDLASKADLVVAAWGNHGRFAQRWKDIVVKLDEIYCLDLTKQGQPRHPLYAKKNLVPWLWQPELD